MDDVIDEELYRRTEQLLEPGEIELDGLILHTDLEGPEDVEMMEATLAVGDLVAEHAGHDPGDVYVHSGNDDPEFASNQHQGLTVDDEEFVWECQQLLRGGTYDVVFYFEADADLDGLVAAAEDAGHRVQPVRGR
ncbi:MAG: DUF5778 family protein [Halobacteriales archaeon]